MWAIRLTSCFVTCYQLESLIHLVLPGLLEEGALGTDTYEETDTKELARAHRLQRVKKILRPFILRRLKEEVAKELIPKTQGTFILLILVRAI